MSCWKCWSPLASAAPPAPEAPPPSPNRSSSPPPTDPPEPRRPVGTAAFAYVSAPVVQAESRGATWLIITAAALVLCMVAVLLFWYLTFRPHARAVEPAEVASDYLTALAIGDVATQQQLAAADSKGAQLPDWLIIQHAELEGAARVQGAEAEVAAAVTLGPGPADTALSQAQTGAVTQTYRVILALRLEDNAWRIDQRRLFADLRETLARDNPQVSLPAWE